MKNFLLFLFLIFSTALITSVLALRTEGIFNGEEGSRIQRQYVAAIFAVKSCRRSPKHIGSGALVDTHYVLSSAHHFVDLSFLGNYKLKPKTFYVHLGASDLYSDSGELVLAESFYLLGYNITTCQNDLILIKTARTRTEGMLPWDPVYMAGDDLQQFAVMEGRVASHGTHNTELDMDGKLRFAVANIVDNSNCDHNFSEDSPQLCIKMSKDPNNQPRGLCKIGQPDLIGILPGDAVHVATQNMHELAILEGRVASYGLHNIAQGLDGNLILALANMADNSKCDNILDANSSQICIKMYKDDKNHPRGLCKYDGGAPFVVRNMNENYLVGIASKPKENCDDTERGAVYTDVRPFHSHIISIIAGNPVASQILEPDVPGGYACLNLML